jgi:hypothetical protein
VYPDERVARLVTENFIPARVHVREQAADFQRFGERFGAQWTPTILALDPGGVERHRVEGFLEAEELLPQLVLALAQMAFQRNDWKAAERHFGDVVQRFPDGDAAPEARYWMGVSRYKASGDAAALAETERDLSARYPQSSWARKASVWKR